MAFFSNHPFSQVKNLNVKGRDAAAPGIIPTGLGPPIEAVTNYSFFTGKPIVSASESRLPPEMQSKANTSEIAKIIGGTVNVSPAKIEHIWNGYTASLGRSALDIVDSLLGVVGLVSKAPKPEKTAAETPILRAFVSKEPIGSQSESVDKFYTLLQKSREAKAGMQEFAKQGKGEDLKKFTKDNPEFLFNSGLESMAQTMSNLRQRRESIYNSKDMDPKAKREAITKIDTLMTKLAKQSVETSEKLMKRIKERGGE